jgi:hypothetical protein
MREMIVYQDTIQAVPGQLQAYLEAFGRDLIPILREVRKQYPFGLFRVVPGFGRYGEVIWFCGIKDWHAWGGDVLTTEGHHDWDAVPPRLRTWAVEALQYRRYWTKEFLHFADFSPSYDEVMADKATGRLFIHATYQVTPGKMDDWLAFVEREVLPVEQRRGLKLIAFFKVMPGAGRSDDCRELWAVDNWDHWDQVMRTQATDNEFQAMRRASLEFRPRWVTRLLLPGKYSPIQ